MIIDRYDPMNLFALIPQLTLEMDPELAALDPLLEDDVLFCRVKADLCRRFPHSDRLGRHSTPVEVILRVLVLRRLYAWSYRQTEHWVADSLVLRQFARVYCQAVPDYSTLERWNKLIGHETMTALNEHVVRLAQQVKVTRGRKLREDGTVVETTIHYPTDSALLSDGVRIISRLVGQAQQVLGGTGELFRNRSRSAKRLARQIGEASRRKGKETKAGYRQLLRIAQASLGQARRVAAQTEGGLQQQLTAAIPLLERVIEQTRRRVLEGEQVSASEKVVSLIEPHTAIIKRDKAGQQTEFGHKIWLQEVDGGIISHYRVLEGNPPEAEQVLPGLEHHQQLFGKPPEMLAGDRGVYAPGTIEAAEQRGVRQVAIPIQGKSPPEREREPWFRRGQRFRAGIEGRISGLKRRGFLGRCPDHGQDGFECWIGWGILTHNLRQIARHQLAKEAAQ